MTRVAEFARMGLITEFHRKDSAHMAAEDEGQITRYGVFADGALESAYRSHHAVADRRLARTCVLVSVLGSLVFVLSDYVLFGQGASFWALLIARASVIALSLLVWRQLRQDLTSSEYDYMAFFWGLLTVTQILYITSTRPPSYTGHLVVNLSVVLIIYTVLPLPLRQQAILAGILSLGCALLALGQGIATVAVCWSLVAANTLGVFCSLRLHRQGREMFVAHARLEKSLQEVRTLRGLIRLCAWCKKVAVDEERWEEFEAYICEHTHAEFTHGICPECYSAQEEKLAAAGYE